ncbi:MAG: alpha/beta hydrolase [Ruminococcaceae bacterium]|nr:alpha/beta hydrolase [Oscillospiraceae bacterium]
MKKSARNTIIALSALAAASALASYALSRMVVDMAVKRDVKMSNVPAKLQDKITGGMMTDPKLKTIEKVSEAIKLLPTETVKVDSYDGLQLTGHLYKAKDQKRVIIAMHGWRSSWEMDFGAAVKFYNEQGCTVIYADQRGQNDSDGEYIGFGILERYDCEKWAEYAVSRFGTEVPIYLLGVSMGAATVLMASGLELPEQVKGIIADCGFTSPKAIWQHIVDNNLKLHSKLSYPIINRIVKRVASFEGDEYSTLDAMEVNTRPILFIHGSDDNFVPLKMSVDNYLACKAKKDMLIVPGAGHGMSYITDSGAYERAVRRFLKSIEQ